MREKNLEQISEFLKQIRQFQLVYRLTPKPGGGRENDAEHSWCLAITCMLLMEELEEEFDQKLDIEKILKMALIHDLAEIGTGDTVPWRKEERINKEEKERAAMKHLLKNLPAKLRIELMELWEECEAKESLEAKIVKSIDRFDPVIHRTVFNIGWKGLIEDEHATVHALDSRQLPRHSFSKVLTWIYHYFRDIGLKKDIFKK